MVYTKRCFNQRFGRYHLGLYKDNTFFALTGVRKGLGVGHLGDCRHDNGLEQAPEGHSFDLRPFASKSLQE